MKSVPVISGGTLQWIALSDMGYTVQRQKCRSYEVTSVNLEVEIPGDLYPEEIVVVGAHYDTVSGCPSANDNGGTILELNRWRGDNQNDYIYKKTEPLHPSCSK